MARALRSRLTPVVLLLALVWPFPGQSAPIGASIALTNAVFDYQPVAANLSAQAAAIGGLPALPLLHNGIYKDTVAGDFAVTLNLPPLGQRHTWLISDDISINGQHVFGGQDTFGPISIDEAIAEALSRFPSGVQGIIKNIGNRLLTKPQDAVGGLFDWSYNRDPAADLTGTFAVGSTLDLPKLIIGESVIPGEFMFSLSASAVAVDIPEPAAPLILALALLALLALRQHMAHRIAGLATPAPANLCDG